MSELVRDADGTFRGAPPADAEQLGTHPAERLYRVADGWIALCVRGQAMARALIRTLKLESALGEDPATWGEAERAAIATALKARPQREWTTLLESAGIWSEAVREDAEAEFLAGRGDAIRYRLEAPHPHYGRTVQIGPLVTFPGRRQAANGHIPALGEHTASVMAALGYAEADVEGFRARKIVR
jgi:crotonobetainyl-CoA:carnitine CoA-transferase CaiB-like acyl-CoA transferase